MEIQLGLIGYPTKHSLSPWIHERFLTKTGINGSYTVEEIKPNDFNQQIEQLVRGQYDGFNVTSPYKQKIIPYLDELDEHAKHIGAVNTVVHKNGKLIGYNTDGIGYRRSLEQYFPNLFKEGIKVLLIGSGGAARGIYSALTQADVPFIDIANRTIEKARELADINHSHTKTQIITLKQAEKVIQEYQLVIQTTNVGMKPEVNQSTISLINLNKDTVVSDIIYQPIWTKFLKEANALGAKVHHGHTMLLYQAQYAFEVWTGIKPAVEEMDKELKQQLEG